MVKKNFESGINALLRKTSLDEKNAEGQTARTSIMLDHEMLELLRAIAFWKRTTIKKLIQHALEGYLSKIDQNTLKTALNEYRAHQEKHIH